LRSEYCRTYGYSGQSHMGWNSGIYSTSLNKGARADIPEDSKVCDSGKFTIFNDNNFSNGPTTDYLNDNPEVFKSEKPFLNKRKKEVLADRIQIGGANGMIRIERDNKGNAKRKVIDDEGNVIPSEERFFSPGSLLTKMQATKEWTASSYDTLEKNCSHFALQLATILCGSEHMANWALPEELKDQRELSVDANYVRKIFFKFFGVMNTMPIIGLHSITRLGEIDNLRTRRSIEHNASAQIIHRKIVDFVNKGNREQKWLWSNNNRLAPVGIPVDDDHVWISIRALDPTTEQVAEPAAIEEDTDPDILDGLSSLGGTSVLH